MPENKSSAGCFDEETEIPTPLIDQLVQERAKEIFEIEDALSSYNNDAGEPEEEE